MIFIFGTDTKSKQQGEGRFFCPQCSGQRNYRLFHVKEYFSLFFIPVLPMRSLDSYVECDECLTKFRQEVLEYSPDQMMLQNIYQDAVAGMPLQMIERKMTNTGLSDVEAQAAVHQVAKQFAQKECEACQLRYLADANLKSCTACGGDLR